MIKKLIVFIILSTFTSLQYSKNIYVSPSAGCSSSCTGIPTNPYDNIWNAIIETYSTEPLTLILLKPVDTKGHFLMPVEIKDGLYAYNAAWHISLAYDLTIRPLYCDETDVLTYNLGTKCISTNEKISIFLKYDGMRISTTYSLNLINLEFDGKEDISKYNPDSLGLAKCLTSRINCCDVTIDSRSSHDNDIFCSGTPLRSQTLTDENSSFIILDGNASLKVINSTFKNINFMNASSLFELQNKNISIFQNVLFENLFLPQGTVWVTAKLAKFSVKFENIIILQSGEKFYVGPQMNSSAYFLTVNPRPNQPFYPQVTVKNLKIVNLTLQNHKFLFYVSETNLSISNVSFEATNLNKSSSYFKLEKSIFHANAVHIINNSFSFAESQYAIFDSQNSIQIIINNITISSSHFDNNQKYSSILFRVYNIDLAVIQNLNFLNNSIYGSFQILQIKSSLAQISSSVFENNSYYTEKSFHFEIASASKANISNLLWKNNTMIGSINLFMTNENSNLRLSNTSIVSSSFDSKNLEEQSPLILAEDSLLYIANLKLESVLFENYITILKDNSYTELRYILFHNLTFNKHNKFPMFDLTEAFIFENIEISYCNFSGNPSKSLVLLLTSKSSIEIVNFTIRGLNSDYSDLRSLIDFAGSKMKLINILFEENKMSFGNVFCLIGSGIFSDIESEITNMTIRRNNIHVFQNFLYFEDMVSVNDLVIKDNQMRSGIIISQKSASFKNLYVLNNTFSYQENFGVNGINTYINATLQNNKYITPNSVVFLGSAIFYNSRFFDEVLVSGTYIKNFNPEIHDSHFNFQPNTDIDHTKSYLVEGRTLLVKNSNFKIPFNFYNAIEGDVANFVNSTFECRKFTTFFKAKRSVLKLVSSIIQIPNTQDTGEEENLLFVTDADISLTDVLIEVKHNKDLTLLWQMGGKALLQNITCFNFNSKITTFSSTLRSRNLTIFGSRLYNIETILDSKLSQYIQFQNCEVKSIMDSLHLFLAEKIDNFIMRNIAVDFDSVSNSQSMISVGSFLDVSNMTFTNLSISNATIAKSCIVIESRFTSLKLLIENSHFDSNHASSSGGVLKIIAKINIEVIIKSSEFISNSAISSLGNYGGAILFDTSNLADSFADLMKLHIEDCFFMNNTANAFGGAIYSDGMIFPSIFPSVTFQGNYILYNDKRFENHVGTIPAKLGMISSDNNSNFSSRTTLFSPNFDPMPNFEMKDLLNDKAIQSDISISVFDFYDQPIVRLRDSTLYIDAKDPELSSSVNSISTRFGDWSLNRLSFRYKIDSTTNITFMSRMILENKKLYPNYNFSEEIYANLKFRSCVKGEVLTDEDTCEKCPYGRFSDALELNSKQPCISCDPKKMFCGGGDDVGPNYGFSRLNSSSNIFLECPIEDSCLGQPEDRILATSLCREGHTGSYCSICLDQYGGALNGKQCEQCNSFGVSVFLAILFIIFNGAIVFYSIYETLKKKTSQEKSIENPLIKILMNYIQVISLISSANVDWPELVIDVLPVNEVIVPTNLKTNDWECFLSFFSKGTPHALSKMIILNLMPLINLIIAFAFIFIRYSFRKCKKSVQSIGELKYSFIAIFINIAFYFMPMVIKNNLEMFDCIDLYRTDISEKYLRIDYHTKCYEGLHWDYSMKISLPLLVLWVIIIPGIMLYELRRIYRNPNGNEQIKASYSFLTESYKAKFYYWDIISIVRKYIIASIIVFAVYDSKPFVQLLLLTIVIWSYKFLQELCSPYQDEQLNQIESKSLFIAGLMNFGGTYVYLATKNDNFSTFVALLIITCNISFLLLWFRLFIVVFLKSLRKKVEGNKYARKFKEKLVTFTRKFTTKKSKDLNISQSRSIINPSSPQSLAQLNP